MIQYCNKCVTPSSRPGLSFNQDGICLPCIISVEKDKIDWGSRRKELNEIALWGKDNSDSNFDCIIGVSGGKDSTRQALLARDDLGLNPLLVSCTYPPEGQSEIGPKNLANLTSLGFTTISVGPSPKIWKTMMKRSFIKYGSYGKPTEMALYATTPRVAISYKVPLIFLGENNVLTYGDVGGSTTGDGNRMKYNNTLSGGDPSEFFKNTIQKSQAIWHSYPSDKEMELGNLRIVYLGYYYKDFNNKKNAEVAIENGMHIRNSKPEEIGAINNFDALENDFVHVNQMLKYFKFGFGKTTDEVSELIRLGEMERDEAIELVKKYDGKCSTIYIKKFCEYLEFSEDEFWDVANSFRNKNIWQKKYNGSWELKYKLV